MNPIQANIKTGGGMRFSQRMNGFALVLVAMGFGLHPSNGFSANTANFDTAWTFVYDGGMKPDSTPIWDSFKQAVILSNGDAVCAGYTTDSIGVANVLIERISAQGELIQKKQYACARNCEGGAIHQSKSGEYFVGGVRFGSPLLLRLDSQLNLKSSFWYYDSINNRSNLLHIANLQSLVQTTDGRVIAVGGDDFPYGIGSALNNYAVWMEFDSSGSLSGLVRQWDDAVGFEMAGWSLLETSSGGLLMGGNRATTIFEKSGTISNQYKYTFSLKGVGTVTNKVSRVRKLPNGKLLAFGQAYEEDCWTKYQRLSYDGWWSFISETGSNDSWNTAGLSGSDDALFDATQLTDNRIAFLGLKGTVPDSGLWVFVTDSTAKTVLWERQLNLPGMDGSFTRNNLDPYSMAATPDSGFIVVGRENSRTQGKNAFAIKFVPKPMPVSNLSNRKTIKDMHRFNSRSLTFDISRKGIVVFREYDLRGQLIQVQQVTVAKPGTVEFRLASSKRKNRLTLWELDAPNERLIGKALY